MKSESELHKTASGDFEHNNITVHYDMFTDGFSIFIKAMYDGKLIEYQRDQSKNFRDDFVQHLNSFLAKA